MAPERRPRRPSLSDRLDLDDVDGSLDLLDALTEREFDDHVLLYLRGDRRGMEIMRHPDNVERLYEALTRLRGRYRRRYSETRDASLADTIRSIEIERRDVAEEAKRERDIRIREQAVEREAEVLARPIERLERALDKQRRLRAEIEAAQAKTPRARALERLRKAHEPEFLRYVREEKARDREQAANDEGAADPSGPTAPSMVAQAAVV